VIVDAALKKTLVVGAAQVTGKLEQADAATFRIAHVALTTAATTTVRRIVARVTGGPTANARTNRVLGVKCLRQDAAWAVTAVLLVDAVIPLRGALQGYNFARGRHNAGPGLV
jgi:hypothetical protein